MTLDIKTLSIHYPLPASSPLTASRRKNGGVEVHGSLVGCMGDGMPLHHTLSRNSNSAISIETPLANHRTRDD